MQSIIDNYRAAVHKWLPILNAQKFDDMLTQPTCELGSDIVLLLLVMKLISTSNHELGDIHQNVLYQTTKRLVALMEATGATSLNILQANLLVAWFEYGHAVYPAAYITSGWSLRYGNLLGLNEHAKDVPKSPSAVGLS